MNIDKLLSDFQLVPVFNEEQNRLEVKPIFSNPLLRNDFENHKEYFISLLCQNNIFVIEDLDVFDNYLRHF